ncbi:D-ribose ABC transporter substrate-binding protein [Acidihalobacter ferrooxydans]|uniref:D-ribose-binding protein n=1 Tax=Acidihalobacter ferrooxydans TaxID=1765967 RepID=A0A1P8UD34_9GAMM|nr:D-ribose ABC transporter substrate-binding protein [Acidihalobacter ferrooxydans]APZ41703.1 D-ribose-binding protein [Acidihalobacter ferrooxydans]
MKTLKQKFLRSLLVAAAGLFAAVPIAASATQQYTFALLLSTLNNPYFVTMKNSAQAEAKRLGVKLLVLDGNNSSTTQSNQVRTAIARKVNLLLINPTNATAMSPAVKEANRAGVPVIFVDRKTDAGKAIGFFASDNVQAGEQACNYISQRLHGKGQIAMLLGIPGASATNERSAGCETALKKHPGIHIVARQTANFSREDGLNVMRNVLIAHPNLDAVYAENGQMGIGAMKAIDSASTQHKPFIVIVGSNSPYQQKLIKEGKIALSVAQQPGKMVAMAIEAGQHYLQDGVLFVPVPLMMDKAPGA